MRQIETKNTDFGVNKRETVFFINVVVTMPYDELAGVDFMVVSKHSGYLC